MNVNNGVSTRSCLGLVPRCLGICFCLFCCHFQPARPRPTAPAPRHYVRCSQLNTGRAPTLGIDHKLSQVGGESSLTLSIFFSPCSVCTFGPVYKQPLSKPLSLHPSHPAHPPPRCVAHHFYFFFFFPAQRPDMADAADEQAAMASLSAAKTQLRAAMKQKLRAVSHESIMSQSTRAHLHGSW